MLTTFYHSLGASPIVFAVSTPAITIAGIFMSNAADRLADRTGWGRP